MGETAQIIKNAQERVNMLTFDVDEVEKVRRPHSANKSICDSEIVTCLKNALLFQRKK